MIDNALNRLRDKRPAFEPGHVWLAGAGPGSMEMLTIGVLAAVMEADIIVYDALVDPDLLDYARPDAERVYMGKRGGQPSASQDEINRRIVELARRNLRVLRLKGGDPFIFARGGEEAVALHKAGVPFRVLSGVTAAIGAAASTVTPITMRGVNNALVLMTGHDKDGVTELDYAALARLDQPIVIYMGLTYLAEIAARLRKGGMDRAMPVAVVQNATRPNERILISTLEEVAEKVKSEGLRSPALVYIGRVVPVGEKLREMAAEFA
ncbi:uroporphyrinogen-III C-methyltransferase [Notoacmeibacter sp. MSK16QG-6]|uniref:uroporphyrinogen-III C-methyltransferase n=1 Tax=Notoacmeibacter sp. MSK16QG-6 TaxID=2957982 RepID=UPI00209FAEE3|nr:uroporphyrinogen-III C-methyltransferase [Notoacmeibacter sp. MSK16QG-6]MCP1199794.1 uroporphyrinogen-III C-methyltransferase [Notoacmeibacter sp. MSK16QG-6]